MAKAPAGAFLTSNASTNDRPKLTSLLWVSQVGCHREAPQLMRAWANYVNPVKAENVVPIHKRVSVQIFVARPEAA